MYSDAERTAHVLRRLSLGGQPGLIDELDSPDDAISFALDLSVEPKTFPEMESPASFDEARAPRRMLEAIGWWIDAAAQPTRLVEERLTWYWMDHFATSLRKVPIPYVLWQQHLTIRRYATGNFADLLHAIATHPAMLFYLDGTRNHKGAINENYAREVMELHTMGPGHYSQDDVLAAARAFTGWVVKVPSTRADVLAPDLPDWAATFIRSRHDGGSKTLLGVTADHDLASALDVLLEQPATRRFVAARLHEALVGLPAAEPDVDRLADAFADYEIMRLVEAIVTGPAFLSEDAIRSQVRTPFDRLLTITQTFGLARGLLQAVEAMLPAQQFIPFAPPNPAGYPSGSALLGPHALVHGFDLTSIVRAEEAGELDPTGSAHLRRLGVRDVSEPTRAAIAGAKSPASQLALAINAPEMLLQ